MAKGRRRSSAVRRVRPVARRERYVRRRDRGRRVRGRSCGHVLFDRRPTLASCVSSPPTITRSGLQRSFGARRLARHAYEGAWRSMFAACRGGGSRDAGVAGARGIRAMLERRAPVRLRRRRPIVPPRSTKRTACRASAARRASSPAFRRARAAVALSPLSSTLSSLVR